MNPQQMEWLRANMHKVPAHDRERILDLLEQYDAINRRERCREDFMAYVRYMWPQFIAGRHHQIIADTFNRIADGTLKRLMIHLPPRHKLLITEEIPTTRGFVPMRDIVPGDYVYGPDGRPRQVTGKSAVYEEPLFRVTTSDGATLVCDGAHLWTVRYGSRRDAPYKTYSTEQLYAIQQRSTSPNWKPKLPCIAPVQGVEHQLPVHPYVLGVWLGDGATAVPTITSGYADVEGIRANIEACGYETRCRQPGDRFGIVGLAAELRAAGVLGNKHVPDAYWVASETQRLQLLQGLIDTDGHVAPSGKVEFCSTEPQLAEAVAALVRSMGRKARVTTKRYTLPTQVERTAYRVCFKLANAAWLTRKAQNCRDPQGNQARTLRVEPLGVTGPCQCLQVENEDGLFLAGRGYIVTHNTKSEFGSKYLPSWLLGRKPSLKIIQTSNTAELAQNFGRQVRNVVGSGTYQEIFPDTELRADSKAAGRWDTNHNGTYYATGVGGSITGRGADILIIDDPHTEQEAAQAEFNPEIYDSVYNWYTSGPRQRLQPGGAIVVIMCMTGDTEVLLADGTSRPLAELRVGDEVATYEQGRITTSQVANWTLSGVDTVYKIKTQSGRIIRANERHPFLVEAEGEQKWVPLKHLKPGMALVATRAATDPQEPRPNLACARHVRRGKRIGARILTRLSTLLGTTASGKACSALVAALLCRKENATAATYGLKTTNPRQSKHERVELKSGMALPLSNTTPWWRSGTTGAISAGQNQQIKTHAATGRGSCVSTIATLRRRSAGFFATAVTWLLGIVSTRKCLSAPLSTYDVTLDRVTSIQYDGRENVYDVEIDRTENFIANGVVSHNTKWSKRDLAGRILKESAERDGDDWEVIEFPAIFNEHSTDPGRPEAALWPEYWPLEELRTLRNELPLGKWMAQYQQNPTSDTTAIVKREWWRSWEMPEPPVCSFVLMCLDTAFEAHNRADYSAFTTWGVFYHPDDTGQDQANIILLNAFRDRLEFPDLKRVAKEQYMKWQPDSMIVEKKASGAPLIYELRSAGIPVTDFTPVRGKKGQSNDKIARLNAVSDIFSSGRVWAPNTHWAEEVIEEVASFPAGDHDDYTDTCLARGTLITMADGTVRPIEQVEAGAYVATPLGPRQVRAAGSTGVRPCHTLETTVGVLRGTAEHPVWCDDQWTPLIWLPTGGKLEGPLPETIACPSSATPTYAERRSGLTAALITATPTPSRKPTAPILCGLEGGISCTAMCGSTTTDPSLRAWTSTIRTVTLPITLSAIWKWCRVNGIWPSITMPGWRMPKGPSSGPIWRRYAPWRQSGTRATRVEIGTDRTPVPPSTSPERPNPTPNAPWWRRAAVYVMQRTRPKYPKNGSTAPTPAPARPIDVVRVSGPGNPEPVYNLSVDEAECYYANGILVHNCSMALARFRNGGFIGTAMDVDDEDEDRVVTRAYY